MTSVLTRTAAVDHSPEYKITGKTCSYEFRRLHDLAECLRNGTFILNVNNEPNDKGNINYNISGRWGDRNWGRIKVAVVNKKFCYDTVESVISSPYYKDKLDEKGNVKAPTLTLKTDLLQPETPNYVVIKGDYDCMEDWQYVHSKIADQIYRVVEETVARVRKASEDSETPMEHEWASKTLSVVAPKLIKMHPPQAFKPKAKGKEFIIGQGEVEPKKSEEEEEEEAEKMETAATTPTTEETKPKEAPKKATPFDYQAYLKAPGRAMFCLSRAYIWQPTKNDAEDVLMGGLICELQRGKFKTPEEKLREQQELEASKKHQGSFEISSTSDAGEDAPATRSSKRTKKEKEVVE